MNRRLLPVLVLAGLAVAVGAVAIALAFGGFDTDAADTARVCPEIRGIAQDGPTLGATDAPATVEIFAQLTDLRTTSTKNSVLHDLVEPYVRPGRVRARLRTITSGDQQASEVARTAQAVGLQDRMWEFYCVVSDSYAGYFDEEAQETALKAIPRLDAQQADRDASSDRVTAAIARADRLAREHGVETTPTFVFVPDEGRPRVLRAARRGGLREALARAIGRPG